MDLKGRLLANRYEILEKIGSGGMATVYKAKCHVLNRYVAIKILRDEFTTDEEFVKRFEVEAQSAASITHPNIVSVYDVGVDGNLHYIVMELVKGKTLKDIIVEEKGPLPWKWSVNIAIQIASALETAHKNHIIHRDIKPHNIIITEDGVAKVTDFGIAKAVSNSTITAFGTTIGSVHYFSPEHARGGFTDEKSDIYSLGVVMYEMLTGRVPFDADTPVSVALKHMQEEPIAAIVANPNIPIAVNDIIMKSLKKDPNLRYQSATAMLIDLKRALKEPQGNFVDNNEYVDAPTQRISTIQDDNRGPKATAKKKENKFVAFVKKHKVLSTIVGLILLFVLSLGITYFVIELTTPKNVDVPDLTGLTVEQAESKLKDIKVNYKISSEEYSSDIEKGKIISQDPKEGYKILEKGTISIVLSKGTETVKVPKVAGSTYEEAESSLSDLNLNIEKIEETSQKIQEGVVIKQDPKENTEVKAGDTVKVYVSKGTGIKQVAVPSVVGETEENAKKSLTEKGFEVSVTYEEDTKKSNGEVLKQSLDVGKTVDEGTKIVLTVNKLAEIKKGTVNVNVKSITKYKPEVDEDGNEIEAEKVEVTVKVTSAGTEDTVYKKKVGKDTENINLTVQGVGTITVKVYVSGILERQTQMNLNDSNAVWTAE